MKNPFPLRTEGVDASAIRKSVALTLHLAQGETRSAIRVHFAKHETRCAAFGTRHRRPGSDGSRSPSCGLVASHSQVGINAQSLSEASTMVVVGLDGQTAKGVVAGSVEVVHMQ